MRKIITYQVLMILLLALLEGSQSGEDGLFGYLAFSFIAGYKVDRFLKKMEDVAQSKFGVRPSRTSKNSAEGD